MDILERVLRWAQAGETIFEPMGSSDEHVQDFQVVADALIHAAQRGYLTDCQPAYESDGRQRYCSHVAVGAITQAGRSYLNEINHQTRPMPEVFSDAMYGLPFSGDAAADELLSAAIQLYRQTDLASRKAAVEKLWDAWDRLKTLPHKDPFKGNRILLANVAHDAKFRAMLEREATQLHQIGNEFHIRHFKTAGTPIVRIEHYDYLFHRLLALLYVLMVSLRVEQPEPPMA